MENHGGLGEVECVHMHTCVLGLSPHTPTSPITACLLTFTCRPNPPISCLLGWGKPGCLLPTRAPAGLPCAFPEPAPRDSPNGTPDTPSPALGLDNLVPSALVLPDWA